MIEQAVRAIFQAHGLPEDAIAAIATIDTKAGEAGLIEFCHDRHLPLLCFSAAQLRLVAVPHPSGAIATAVGTPSVAEAAALLASWEAEGERGAEARGGGNEGRREQKKLSPGEASKRYPLSAINTRHRPSDPYSPTPALYVPKQIVRQVGKAGLVTVAIARSQPHRDLET
jgi:cobalt-precorrin 5A hydrolase/precorrin-3B C17-methyltransferase